MRLTTVWGVGLAVACASGCAEEDFDDDSGPPEFRDFDLMTPLEPATVRTPTDAFCTIKVANHGNKAAETDYLPNVLACEAPANADLGALEALAISARSYVYYHMATQGSICNGQGCQVYSCGRTPSAEHRRAVEETSGLILSYNDNLTVGFYVAGDKTPNADCSGNSGGVGNTERYVTYNEGKSGTSITQTRLGWRHDASDGDWGQNRGALSQWGAQCLADKRDYDAVDILNYYYGEDIGIVQVEGACIGHADIGGGTGGGGATEACGTIDPDFGSTIDNGDDCFELDGPSQYWRTESEGHGGTLNWTKSTLSSEHNVATWFLNFEASGDYFVEVHIDPDHTTAEGAKYEVVDGTLSRTVTIDQTQGGWIGLGVFPFDANVVDQQVKMTDAIGVRGLILQADALRVTPAELCDQTGCNADQPADAAAAPDLARGGDAQMGCAVDPRGARPSAWALGVLLAFMARRLRGSTARPARAPRR